jgi:hypothetical protein
VKERDLIVQITVSSHHYGSTDNLLAGDGSWWQTHSRPNSWIQWALPIGIKAIISSVKITGIIWEQRGVRDFILEGSNDSRVWKPIIDSRTCPITVENSTTQGKALPQPGKAFSIIRLTQTGPEYFPSYSGISHHLTLTYVDFGGRIIFSSTAREE